MQIASIRRFVIALVVLAAGVGLAWLLWPRPVPIDLAPVVRRPMEVTVDEDARTRVRHIYTVSAPVAGKVLRTTRHVGDEVVADDTVVAVMEPTAPGFHDVRSHEELQGALAAAEASVRFAEAEIRRIEASLDYSRSEFRRAQLLARSDAISAKALDRAKFDVETNEAALASAKAQLEVRRSERASAAARLMDPTNAISERPPTCCVEIRAPVTGRVLKIQQESEAVVLPGTPLIDIGDPRDLEIVADLLSPDAVQIKPGARVRVDGWGGRALKARINRIEPAGFVKVSALGIEEQRVRAIIDLIEPPEEWSALGHDFRVVVHVTTWSSDDALVIPIGALFRQGDEWAAFIARDGRAQATRVQVGHRNNRAAEVLTGLAEGDRVVLHPSDRVEDGTPVSERDD